MPFGAMASSEAYPSFLVCIFLHVDGWLKPYDLLGWIHNDDVAERVASAWQRRGYWTAGGSQRTAADWKAADWKAAETL